MGKILRDNNITISIIYCTKFQVGRLKGRLGIKLGRTGVHLATPLPTEYLVDKWRNLYMDI